MAGHANAGAAYPGVADRCLDRFSTADYSRDRADMNLRSCQIEGLQPLLTPRDRAMSGAWDCSREADSRRAQAASPAIRDIARRNS